MIVEHEGLQSHICFSIRADIDLLNQITFDTV